MLNIDLNDTTIKLVMTAVVIAMALVIFFVLAPKAYTTEQAIDRAGTQSHKEWVAANTNHDADKDVYY